MFIVTKKIDSENISKLCRTCLREDGDKMVYLFVGPAGSSLAAKLRSLSCLEVWQGDGLPEKMCDKCVTRAESALLYREQCRAADRALRQAALKVAGVTSYTTVSGCKLYQENQGFVPIQNSQKTLKCIECGAVFMNYQELCAHNRLHVPFYQENNMPLHIFDPQTMPTNFGPSANNHVNNTNEIPTLIKSGTLQSMPLHGISPERNSCALHCSLCNHTFSNKMQLINHNYTHSADTVDLSCDEENVEIGDNSNNLSRNLTYGSTIQNLSYTRANTNENDVVQNLSFPDSLHLSVPEENSLQIPQNDHLPKISEDEESQNNLPYKPRERKYECEQCGRSFLQKSKLQTHLLVHSGRRPFKCHKCEKAYTSKSKLNAHLRLHTRTNVHQCRICDKVFSYPSYLEEHSKVHEPKSNDTEVDKHFECSICKKTFRVEKNLKTHLRLHGSDNLLHCELCDKKFSRKYGLKSHLLTHRPAKLHKCEFCSKYFTQKSNLVEHTRIHTKTKPFVCKLCGKCFAQSSHLKSHQASHESVRQHQCKICGKRFKLASHLKRHMNLHTGSKVYKCDECEQLFSHAFSLKRHSRKHNESHV